MKIKCSSYETSTHMQYFKVSSVAMCRLIFHHYSKNYSPNYLRNEYLKVVKKIR